MPAPIADLHPDDAAARDALATTLVGIARTARLSGKDLAVRLGVTPGAVSHMRHSRGWIVPTVQCWARALDHRLHIVLDGIEVPEGDELAELYAAMRPKDPAAQDRLNLRAVVNDLACARRHLRITQAALSARLGLSESAASWWELKPDGARVASIQRYARVLGGVARFEVAPVSVEAVAG